MVSGVAWPRLYIRMLAVLLCVWAGGAAARPAHCSTSDDGDYACDFKAMDKDGSFQITARGKPLYIMVMEEPGRAEAFVNLGNRNISLAGTYVRSASDPACWVSDSTAARICVR